VNIPGAYPYPAAGGNLYWSFYADSNGIPHQKRWFTMSRNSVRSRAPPVPAWLKLTLS
jgi:hypothetical protein